MKKLLAMTDHELVSEYEIGNDSAFDVLLKRYQDYVFSYIVFLVKRTDEAEDILQETFVKAIVALRNHKYQKTGKFGAWLIRIAHNIVVDYLRGTDQTLCTLKDEFSQDILNTTRLSEKSQETKLVEQQPAMTLHHMLDYLPEDQRTVVILRFFEDMSFKEIAAKTNVSINTALGRMRYALINLRKMVQEHRLDLVG
ncbi:MAG: sigma-70 family RNA polymerase sigma factor [Bacteroidaceae bacterium]|nr:sigma-70 family RNA polymerase sigma factor [Bacteroidaceae bacterium]